MAVYERTYHGYEGSLTPAWSRFLIVPRYSYREVFQLVKENMKKAAEGPEA